MPDSTTSPIRRTSPLLLNDYHATQQAAMGMTDAEYAAHRAAFPPPWEGGAAPAPAEPRRPSSTYRKRPIPKELRWAVWERDNFTCRRCGARRDLAADHVVSERLGGATTLDNLQTLCARCNSSKGARV